MTSFSGLGEREHWVVRAGDQRAADEAAYASGIETDSLMERAGAEAAEWILNHRSPGRTLVLAGPGGNGGDALVAARHLAAAGIEVRTIVVPPPDAMSPAAGRMLATLRSAGGDVACINRDPCGWEASIGWADTVVDGFFGAGLTRALAEPYDEIVRAVNGAHGHVISIDLPSGLASDRSDRPGETVCADVTLAMAFLKPAHLFYPAAEFCGNTAVVPVGYPESVLETMTPQARVLAPQGAGQRLPRRRPDGHKGTFGRVLVIAGSTGMTGAAMLACRGAHRTGAGLVTLACPRSLNPILETALPEVVTVPYPDTVGRLSPDAIETCIGALERADLLAIGPGLSREPETLRAVAGILRNTPVPTIIDADSLSAFHADPGLWSDIPEHVVLTPHPGEFELIGGAAAASEGVERIETARRFAQERGVTLLLKGRPTAIADPGGDCFLNPTGNTGLAKGGSGDVLTGLIAGLSAGGAPLFDAALAAAYIHGAAADGYRTEHAERSMMPSDVLNLIPRILKEIEP